MRTARIDSGTVLAGATDPRRKMPEIVLPRPIAHAIEARWLGQDGSQGGGSGDVHVALAGLPAGRAIAAAALSDAVPGYWVYRSRPDQALIATAAEEAPLVLRRGG